MLMTHSLQQHADALCCSTWMHAAMRATRVCTCSARHVPAQERYAGLLRLAGLKINGLTDLRVTVGFTSNKVPSASLQHSLCRYL